MRSRCSSDEPSLNKAGLSLAPRRPSLNVNLGCYPSVYGGALCRVFGHVECYKAEGVEFRLLCGRLS